MKHLGDITKIKGNEAPTVDCIIGGSPCQDLSLAGKRAGLAGARSGLYMEQVRIIKEMRENDRVNGRTGVDVRPRYMVWENVPGAFSTNKGQDFAAVLEEAIRVAEPEAPSVPVPEKGWPTSGCIVGEQWSVAWRVLDAQFWGTSDKPLPQRRRRIAFVADFGGLSAPEILFVRKSVSGDIEPGKPKGKETAGEAGGGSGRAVGGAFGCDTYNYTVTGDKACTLNSNSCITSSRVGPTVAVPKAIGFPLGFRPENVRCYDEVATTLCNGTRPGFTTGVIQSVIAQREGAVGFDSYNLCTTGEVARTLAATRSDNEHLPVVVYPNGAVTFEPGIASREGGHIYDGVSGTPRANGGDNQMAVAYENPLRIEMTSTKNTIITDGICPTLTARMGTGGNQVNAILSAVGFDAFNQSLTEDVTKPLTASAADSDHVPLAVCCTFQNTGIGWWNEESVGATLRAMSGGDAMKANLVVNSKYIVRRLTPLECERLQGFPDGWTLIGDPVEEEIADYVPVFDESKYIAPNPADFGLTEDDLNDYAPVDDEDSLDDEDVYDDNYLEYLNACAKARSKATKRVKVGSHKEINYYYTDSSGKRKKVSDSARYKALGNSIALPPWKWVLKRLCACYERDATMASLFDGIGGFPLIWEQINGKGSCLWASEIEEFPMAVTKARFGE